MPGKQWEEEESSSSAASSPNLGAVQIRRKFDDEEAEDSDVLDSWDAAEDSEAEREKAKKAVEAKAKADAAAAAARKSKAQRVAEHKQRRKEEEEEEEEEEDSDDDETEAQRRDRLRRTEKEADLRHAEDLFGDVGGATTGRKAPLAGTAVMIDAKDPQNTVNLADLKLFNPTTKAQFEQLRNMLAPMLAAHSKKPHYVLFLEEFTKQLAKDLPSDQIKKVSSKLTALSNEKMKEEKAAEKGGKKTKAAKTKISLVASRPNVADVGTYEDAFGDDDFM